MKCPHCGVPLVFCNICDCRTYCEPCSRCYEPDELDESDYDREAAENAAFD